MKSDTVKRGFERTPHRALFRAVGLDDQDFGKPFIGIANSYNTFIAGHIHLNEITEAVSRAITDSGGDLRLGLNSGNGKSRLPLEPAGISHKSGLCGQHFSRPSARYSQVYSGFNFHL